MKKVTKSDANRQFTDLTRLVDEEGEVTLTKHGKAKYVLMTIEKYEGRESFEEEMRIKAEKGFAVKNGDDIWHIRFDGENATIIKKEYVEDELDYYKVIELPSKSVSFIKGNPVTIHIEKKGRIQIIAREAGYEEDDLEEKVNSINPKEFFPAKITGFREVML